MPNAEFSSGRSEHTRSKGARGEDRAVDFLVDKGYTVVARNYRTRNGEIDCIAKDTDGTTVFIEVKSSTSTSCGHPSLWVTPAKQRKLMTLARCYLAAHGTLACKCRFDVVALTPDKIEHIRNAIIG